MRPEVVPLLLVALLLLSVQPGVDSFTTVVGGTQDIDGSEDAVLVVDGAVEIPADATRVTSVYVLDGSVRIDGTLAGDLVQLSGHVDVSASGAVTGSYDAYGGTRAVAEGAAVRPTTAIEPLAGERSLPERAGLFAMQALGLAIVAGLVGRRFAALFDNVGHAVRKHPVVSATVGSLATVTLLALFVFMAFTLVLLPVSVLGLIAGAVVLLYAYLAVGYVLGTSLPVADPRVQTAAGAVGFLTATELLALVPVVGSVVTLVVLLTAVGAVFITYFGLRQFQPPQLQHVKES